MSNSLGRNVEATVEGDKLTLVVDLSKDFGPSKSGKTIIVATTGGSAAIPGRDSMKLGLNLFKSR